MQNTIPYEQLPITNNFIFCKVMSDKSLCKEFLEAILKIKIDRLEAPVTEASQFIEPDSRSVRFDVYCKNDDYVFDIEMQMTNNKDLAKRARYYQASSDIMELEKKQKYNMLKENIIIFLCPFDPIGKNKPFYKFQNIDETDLSIKLNDGTTKLFYNFKSYDKIEDTETKEVMKFFATENASGRVSNHFSDLLKNARKSILWRKEYMTMSIWEQDITEAAEKRGSQQKALSTAKIAILMGLSNEQIVQLTGLSIEEVKKLAQPVDGRRASK